jgi:hypothetical protein
MLAGDIAGLCCAAAGAGIGIAAVAAADRVVAGAAAVFLGLAYGLCLVSGLRQAEHMAAPDERGAVIACYYVLAYLGFAVPYLAAGLGALAGKTGAFAALTAIFGGPALWMGGRPSKPIRGNGLGEEEGRVVSVGGPITSATVAGVCGACKGCARASVMMLPLVRRLSRRLRRGLLRRCGLGRGWRSARWAGSGSR